MCHFLCSATVWIAAVFFTLTGPALGGISLISTSRSLSISGRVVGWPHVTDPPPPFSHSVNINTAGTFNHVLQDSIVKDGYGGTAYADQNSTLTVSGGMIVFNGSGKSTGSTFPSPSQPGGEAASTSDFLVTFSADTPATYTLDMNVVPDSTSMNPAAVRLQSGSGLLLGAGPNTPWPTGGIWHYSGTLDPGVYTLDGYAYGSGGPDHYQTRFSVDFKASAVPLPPAALSALVSLPVALGAVLAIKRRTTTHEG